MKVKIDENIPARLAAARSGGRFFITQDLDFSDVRQYRPGTHAGLLLVRLREPGANALLERISTVLREHELDTLSRCFAVLTERKIRIRRG